MSHITRRRTAAFLAQYGIRNGTVDFPESSPLDGLPGIPDECNAPRVETYLAVCFRCGKREASDARITDKWDVKPNREQWVGTFVVVSMMLCPRCYFLLERKG